MGGQPQRIPTPPVAPPLPVSLPEGAHTASSLEQIALVSAQLQTFVPGIMIEAPKVVAGQLVLPFVRNGEEIESAEWPQYLEGLGLSTADRTKIDQFYTQLESLMQARVKEIATGDQLPATSPSSTTPIKSSQPTTGFLSRLKGLFGRK